MKSEENKEPSTTIYPLVSIIVSTYNSSKYVLETLESAKAQTYENIELIVSDDFSTDNTVEICSKWIAENKERFLRTEIITADKNTGIAPNCNRGVRAAHGEWVKLIAGDDILTNDCINLCTDYIKSNPATEIFASKAILFSNGDWKQNGKPCNSENNTLFNKGNSFKEQFASLIRRNSILAPTVFISKQLWQKNNFFDEDIPYMEDYPFWIKTLKNGIKIDFLNEVTVAYRLHTESISGYEEDKIFNSFYKKDYLFRKIYLKPYLNSIEMFSFSYKYIIMNLFDKFNLNHKKYRIPYKILLKLNIFG